MLLLRCAAPAGLAAQTGGGEGAQEASCEEARGRFVRCVSVIIAYAATGGSGGPQAFMTKSAVSGSDQ